MLSGVVVPQFFFLRNGNGVDWGVSSGALLQRPKARCLLELVSAVDRASLPSPTLSPRPLPTQFLLPPTIMQSWYLYSFGGGGGGWRGLAQVPAIMVAESP